MAEAMVQVNVRIEPTLYAKVKNRAKKDGVTVTAVINAALAKAVAS
jgi:predicted HicB family RNase H-like nuclease